MLRQTYARLSSVAEKHAEDIVTTAFENWPIEVQQRAIAQPVHSIPVSAKELEALLAGNSDRREFKRGAQAYAPLSKVLDFEKGPAALFPKIGPVSWKEFSSFRTIASEDAEACFPAMLGSITSRMAIILDAFVICQVPTFVHFFPALDLSSFAEARITVSGDRITAARWQRLPEGVVPGQAVKERVMEFAALVSMLCPVSNLLVDVCFDCLESTANPKLVEINPNIPQARRAE